MNIQYVITPGKFPTVVHDPGNWFYAKYSSNNSIGITNLNESLWRILCSDISEIIAKTNNLSFIRKKEIKESGIKALEALEALREDIPYSSSLVHTNIIKVIAKHLNIVNSSQNECIFNLFTCLTVNGLNTNNSRMLLNYAYKKTLLSHIMTELVKGIPLNTDITFMKVTSRESLLCSMIIAIIVKKVNPKMHICLADHSYESFSLTPIINELKKTNTLPEVFDTIVEDCDDKDMVIYHIIESLSKGQYLKGFIVVKDINVEKQIMNFSDSIDEFPYVPTFAAKKILWMRISNNGCYWSKCAFCTQNSKHDKGEYYPLLDLDAVLDKIQYFIRCGYGHFIFSDEALSPAILYDFSKEVLKRGLSFKWTCRARLEKEFYFNDNLLQLLSSAGCYEILFGMESASSKVLKLMNKYSEVLKRDEIEKIITNVKEAGIRAHITLIAGFPGEEVPDVEDTIDFVSRILKQFPAPTFYLNKFILFKDTYVSKNSENMGIKVTPEFGDMVLVQKFSYTEGPYRDEKVLNELITNSYNKLYRSFGYENYENNLEAEMALLLYFTSGHGVIFKTGCLTY